MCGADSIRWAHVHQKNALVSQWLHIAFGLIYTRANVVTMPAYMAYHVLLVPSLHAAAIALFATIPSKHSRYDGTDVKMTYILMSLTAALDVLAVCIRALLHMLLQLWLGVPALCETIPDYNLVDSVLRRMRRPCVGSLLKCATCVGLVCLEECFFCFDSFRPCKLYRVVMELFKIDLVKVEEEKGKGFDLSTYRSFSNKNWAISHDLRDKCGVRVKRTLRMASFHRSVLIWHIATDLSLRRLLSQEMHATLEQLISGDVEASSEEENLRVLRQLCAQAISNYMAHLLNFRHEMLMTGSRKHLFTQTMQHMEGILDADANGGVKLKLQSKQQLDDEDLGKIRDKAGRHTLIHDACELAEELMSIEEETRWHLMYRVWVGMLCYSASMCRGYLHAKSLGEGGEFLSVVWLIISLKGGKTLADKLQMPEPEE